jgi:hypothetical protein
MHDRTVEFVNGFSILGAAMQPLYFALGAALYLGFAVWCILAPQN